MSYASDHAGAYADVAAAGAAIQFKLQPKTQDSTTGRVSLASEVLVDAVAIEVEPNPKAYEALGLSIRDSLTLFFVTKVFGEAPEIGSRITWRSKTFTFKGYASVTRPDGNLICAYGAFSV